MDLKEINNMDLYREKEHWWIKTRFLYLDKAISKIGDRPFSLLEIGSGTGQNLSYLSNDSKFRDQLQVAIGVDISLPDGFGRNDLSSKVSMTKEMPDKTKLFDVLVVMDVIEHVDHPKELLKQWLQSLKPNGILLVTVPAFQSLWSNHDVLLGHRRRYTRHSLEVELEGLPIVKLYNRYAFSFVFPLVWLARKVIKKQSNETDLKLPPSLVNGILYFLGKVERMLGGDFLLGTSVVGIFRKI
ncbi:MAG: hypothetical protein COW00_12030 [Bdellovibrio sp. CG12_big_fil_rev_8_21_14_0_65_39_13]|nr:MAG: hypothetical protein COW78_16160 [Bdellovibrio sp. CG22_combo_CG10-13_8_21_14_all_39_27]PIQ59107.1 MAG: hypothetical protein COW00_12030 [Bdellovibrio sp. CG12_big_fil_rev_8_21_14_0_65_39_13]PIR33675.1 MAG: hypothetical protein COV37_15425 [Bdellovibrio sp. CG11_big_fil_rev_8_21_14_0_20_39_38]